MIDTHAFNELDHLASNLPQTINGYTFEKLIGKGGFSRVFLVSFPKYKIKFCAKVMPKSLMTDNQNDIDYLLNLEHPNIIRIYDQFIIGAMSYCIIEYCPGGNLHDVITDGKLKGKDKLLFFMQQILLGLEFCHENHVAHRDIKPANILIDRYGRPKLIDFGISVNIEPGELLRDFSGSRPYCPPEVILAQPYDPYKADIWSLGVTFYIMVVGQLPWPKEPEKVMNTAIEQAQYTIPRNVPPAIAKMISSMLQVDPEDRPTVKAILSNGLFPEKAILPSLSHKVFRDATSVSLQTKTARMLVDQPKRLNNSNFFIIQATGNRNCISTFRSVAAITPTMTSMDMFQCEVS
ncbi:CAMK family protein kinase [Tritrichomonas foetus]|uniref:CAMK family protein kinase n=1 Tax=Tritrichomonas foetus TaxID=1144522 RepID=A0A1J4KGE4_9EUKA|nr:CAMK family protein kinase [Tritrichomonas foetus]|eukprot:OHT10275.1 CAMK family protein kinase [Tritrichomonas foetus]